MRWKRCCERRKSATPALTDFALIALSSKKPNACAISEGRPKSSSLTSSKESRCTKGKSITAETMYPVVKSTMICDGPPSRLTKSTDAATATGSLRRFIGWSPKRRLMAVSRKFSLGSCNQWAISKETLLRISRKYFLPFKKRTHLTRNELVAPAFALFLRVRRSERPLRRQSLPQLFDLRDGSPDLRLPQVLPQLGRKPDKLLVHAHNPASEYLGGGEQKARGPSVAVSQSFVKGGRRDSPQMAFGAGNRGCGPGRVQQWTHLAEDGTRPERG